MPIRPRTVLVILVATAAILSACGGGSGGEGDGLTLDVSGTWDLVGTSVVSGEALSVGSIEVTQDGTSLEIDIDGEIIGASIAGDRITFDDLGGPDHAYAQGTHLRVADDRLLGFLLTGSNLSSIYQVWGDINGSAGPLPAPSRDLTADYTGNYGSDPIRIDITQSGSDLDGELESSGFFSGEGRAIGDCLSIFFTDASVPEALVMAWVDGAGFSGSMFTDSSGPGEISMAPIATKPAIDN